MSSLGPRWQGRLAGPHPHGPGAELGRGGKHGLGSLGDGWAPAARASERLLWRAQGGRTRLPAVEGQGGSGAEGPDSSVFHAGARATLPNTNVIVSLSPPMKEKHPNSLSPGGFYLGGAGETQGGLWAQGSPHSSCWDTCCHHGPKVPPPRKPKDGHRVLCPLASGCLFCQLDERSLPLMPQPPAQHMSCNVPVPAPRGTLESGNCATAGRESALETSVWGEKSHGGLTAPRVVLQSV